MAGKGASRRNNVRKAQLKQAAKKMAMKALKSGGAAAASSNPSEKQLSIPTVTEDDLLAFQFKHFGDDAKPEVWFVDAETALEYDPSLEDDGLGYYEDGVKRTLTDEQIEMFRHSEMEQLARQERLQREDEEVRNENAVHGRAERRLTDSPVSEGPGLSTEVIGCALPPSFRKPSQSLERRPLSSTRSDSTSSANGGQRKKKKKKKREKEVPYADRNKRKWEDYIEEHDAVHGSKTHRRIVRELDERKEESVELEY